MYEAHMRKDPHMTSELGRSLRIGRGKNSQQKTAAEFGIDIHTIIMLESGVFVRLDEETLSRLADVARMEKTVFKLMYEQEYQQELRALPKNKMPGETRPAGEASPLSSLEAALESLPAEEQEELIGMFRLMVQAKALEHAC